MPLFETKVRTGVWMKGERCERMRMLSDERGKYDGRGRSRENV
jgi:hypothetical protein